MNNPNSSDYASQQTKTTEEEKATDCADQEIESKEESKSPNAIKSQTQQLWLIRHGERIDETRECDEWYEKASKDRWFDPPLTKKGISQAHSLGKMLQQHLVPNKTNTYWSQVIYVSPCERTLETAFQMAKGLISNEKKYITNVTLSVRPGLAECAAAIRRVGIKKKSDGELQLKPPRHDMHGGRFLSRKEIMEKFSLDSSPNQSSIIWHFAYEDETVHETFEQCVENIMEENSGFELVVGVTHREGIRSLDVRLSRLHVPYCAVAKYLYGSELEDDASLTTVKKPEKKKTSFSVCC